MAQGPEQFEIGKDEKALPEPRRVKRQMIAWQEKAHDAERSFAINQHKKNYDRWRECIYAWYLRLRPYLEDFDSSHRNYSRLENIPKWIEDGKDPDRRELARYTEILDYLMKDLGVTDIGLKQQRGEWGYEFLQGLPFNMKTENEGWRRLRSNIMAMDQLLRDDTDFMILITGQNRVGKDTLAVQICDVADERFGADNIVVDDEDFWTAVNDRPPYSWCEITEMSDHFYSKNAMDGEQKKKKRKLKKFATQNFCLVGCDLNFYNIDKEVRSDKLSVNIHVSDRGQFEFYPRRLIDKFEKDNNTGETVRPAPAFSGSFDRAPGARHVDELMERYDEDREEVRKHLAEKEENDDEELKLWEIYMLKESRKLDVEAEEVEEDAITVPQLVREIKNDRERYLKEWGDKEIVDKDLLKADFDGCNQEKARMAKAKAEADLGIGGG